MEVLDFARREAKKLLVGKAGDGTNELMIGLAKAGRRVVRLSGQLHDMDGTFAACRKAGIAIEAVPGVAEARRAETPNEMEAETCVA
jgi:uroporphyrin-III C-methyltransferase/precorrin-2 dehydrogenase/sirohydrochlorin ferrochelatase